MQSGWRWVIQLHYFEADAVLPLCGIADHQAIAFEFAQHSECPECRVALDRLSTVR